MELVKSFFGDSVRFHSNLEKELIHMMDFAKILYLPKTSRDVLALVWREYRFQLPDGVGKPSWFINEAGAYQMIFSSDHDKAVIIQRWVFEEVLPAIRKNKVYIAPEATSADIITAAQERGINLALELNDQQALLTYNAQLQNRCVDFDGLNQDWLSVSQVLEKRGYKLKSKAIDVSLSQIGKQVKKAYFEATGEEPRRTVKQVGQNHGTEIKSYPLEWHDKIEKIAVTYWKTRTVYELTQ